MKLFLILLAISLQVSAAGYSQEITLSLKKAPLREVMQSIRKQTGYSFIMASVNLKTANPVTITLHTVKIEEALLKIFESQPFSYVIENKSIIIKKKDPAPIAPTEQANTDPIIIKGKVTDKNNKPLPGVNIRIKGRDIGTVTDVNGNYILKADAPGILLFSYIGFRSYEKKVMSKTELNVSLEDISAQLDQVQIIAYGTTTRRNTTSNISTIKGDDIAKQPVSNLLLALQARVPGVNLSQTSGVTGSNVKTRIQGENSIRNGNEAFYVIDGIPISPQNLYSGIVGGTIPGTGSALSFLNPADVESVEFLKDADATAIYGSRAANGAILITTKKGKPGKTKVDLNASRGFGEITKKIQLLNTEQYLAIRSEALKNANQIPGSRDYDLNGEWDKTRNTDWQEKLIGNTSQYTNLQASISGGTNETQFLAGAGYIKETSVFTGDYSDIKANVHVNVNHVSLTKKFIFNISSNYLKDNNTLPPYDPTAIALTLAPNAPEMYNSDGTINWQPRSNNPNSVTFNTNPAAALLRKYKAKTNNFLNSATIGYKILPSLNLKTSFGYNRLETDELNTSPQTSFIPTSTNNNRTATYGTKITESWIIEPQLTFNKEFSLGTVDALLGSSFQSSDNSVVAFTGTNYANDAQLENILAAGTIVASNSTMQSKYRYNAIFGRINYQYRNKYILNFNVRRDGSSRFGSENLFHSFYSIGGAWLFSEENWIRNNLPIITFGKVRATYGTTGNDQIEDYRYLSLYSNNILNVTVPYQQQQGLLPDSHSNPYLQWEETRKFNIGIDIGLLNNSILLNANYYRNRSSNQLLEYGLPYMTGFPSVLRNLPALVQNTGWELQLDGTAIKNQNLNWTVSFNITIPKNKLLSYPNLENSSGGDAYIIGQPVNIKKVYEFAGVNEETGFYQFTTQEGKLTSSPDPIKDRIKTVDLNPKYYGGLTSTFKFRQFEASFVLQFVNQLAQNYKFGTIYPGILNKNQPISVLERWQKVGEKKDIQQITTSPISFTPFDYAINSDAGFTDGSYIRLKNIFVSYSLPLQLLKKINISSTRIYISGQNLLTFTNYQGGDPEIGIPSVLPTLRIISSGLQITF